MMQRKVINVDTPTVSCKVCGAEEIPTPYVIPATDDDADWKEVAKLHQPDCHWVLTRAWEISHPDVDPNEWMNY